MCCMNEQEFFAFIAFQHPSIIYSERPTELIHIRSRRAVASPMGSTYEQKTNCLYEETNGPN